MIRTLPRITVIILTKNEARHIKRAIDSVISFASSVIVVDSGSNDETAELARAGGAVVLVNKWKNAATQINWALNRVPETDEWIFRLDADEIVSENLAAEIRSSLETLPDEVDGVYVSRRIVFLGRAMQWGGIFPVQTMRLFRNGRARCEDRWMDEHMLVEGKTAHFAGEIIDHNLNSMTWWTEKHNTYSSREVIDLLNLEYRFTAYETVADLLGGGQVGFKRWIKERIYARLPSGTRALLYFLYRYVIRLGFLDGPEGTAFHVLQGFWYRYLVDVKLREVKRYMHLNGVDPVTAIKDVLGINVRA